MEWKFRYLFTLCFIMGFQIHMPVTMFPANGDGTNEEHPDTEDGLGIYSMDVLYVDSKSKSLMLNEKLDKDHRAGEFIKSNNIESKQDSHSGASGLESIPKENLNTEVNQAARTDFSGFNIGVKLNGLERGLGTYYSKTSQSVTNRLPQDLRNNKLEQLERRLANLSTNMLTIKNVLPGNNRSAVVNGVEMNADEIDNNNNDTQMKSKLFSGTQTSNIDNTKDTLHGRNENIVKGVLWSNDLVNKCPGGFKVSEIDSWKRKLNNVSVVKLETGCGSMQNRLITFSDRTKACVRYRLNSDQMQGDIYSFYLGKLLGMSYIPPSTLQMLDNKKLWQNVMGDIDSAKWSGDKPLIVSKWEDSLEPVFMPDKLKDMKRTLHQENYQLYDMASGDLCDLVQWSDLIVFDYISANLDRVVNNMFNLQWNRKMFEKPIHNLERSKKTGQLVFLDNESGLFHGYRLLDSYESYHKKLLDSICIFKPSTVEAVKRLYVNGNVGELLQGVYETNEPYHGHLPRMSRQTMKILQSRVNNVYKQMELCEHIR